VLVLDDLLERGYTPELYREALEDFARVFIASSPHRSSVERSREVPPFAGDTLFANSISRTER